MEQQTWMTPDRRADSGDTLAFSFIPAPCSHSGLSTFQISASQVRMHSCPHGKCSRSLHKARPIKINWGSLLSHQVQLLCSHVFIYSLPAERWKFYAGPPPANATLCHSYAGYVEDKETNRSEMRNIRQPRFARTNLKLCFALTNTKPCFTRAIRKSRFTLTNWKPRFTLTIRKPRFIFANRKPRFARASGKLHCALKKRKPCFTQAIKKPFFLTSQQEASFCKSQLEA